MPKIYLLPCPFCGKRETLRMMYVPSEKHELVYHVVCDAVSGGCGASTGWNHETPEEAAKEWNTRASGWIPCSERLPEVNITVLILFENQIKLSCLDKTKLGFLMNGEFIGKNLVTHWAPLPEAPKRKDDTK